MPTIYPGQESSYDASKIVVRQLDDYLEIIEGKEFPLLQAVGLNSFGETVANKYIEWQFDYLHPLTDVLALAITDTIGTRFTVTYAEYFALHDVIALDDELCRVESIDATNNYLYVERGFAGSTANTHLINITIYRLGPSRPEGSSPGWASQVVTEQVGNYCQIFDFYADITGTEEAIKNYAPDDLLRYRIEKKMVLLYQMMERALLYNSYAYAGTATNKSRLSGGLDYWVTDKDNIAAAALMYDDLCDALENVENRAPAHIPTQLWAKNTQCRKISAWGAQSIRTGRAETIFGNSVEIVHTDSGDLSINRDSLIKNTEIWLLNLDEIMIAPLQGRGFAEWDATMPGTDNLARRVIGEYVFVVKGEDRSNDGVHVKLYGISTTL